MFKKFKNLQKISALVLFYLIIGLIFTNPLWKNLGTQIPNNYYVEAQHTYIWGGHLQIFAGFREHANYLKNLSSGEPLYNKEACFGDIESCKFDSFDYLKNVVFSPYWGHTLLNLFLDDPIAYNLSVILSFITTGLAGFLLCDYVVRKQPVVVEGTLKNMIAMIGSLLLVLAPIRIHNLLVGHKNGFLYFLPILGIYLLERFLSEKKFWQIATISIIFFYLSFVEQFFVYFGLIYFGLRVQSVELHTLKLSKEGVINFLVANLKKYLVMIIAIVLIFAVSFASKFKEISTSSLSNGREFADIVYNSPKSISYLWQNGVLEHEHNVYLGAGLLVLLSIVGILVGSLIRKKKMNRDLYFFSFVSIFFILISLGSLTPLYHILYEYLPTFNFSRTPSRAMFFVFPFLSILFANFAPLILSRLNNSLKYLAILFFGAFVIFSYASFEPISLTYLPNTEIIADNQKVLFVPIVRSSEFYNSLYEFQISNSNSVMLNSYHPYTLKTSGEFETNWMERINKLYSEGKSFEDDGEVRKYLESEGVDRVIQIPNPE